MAIKSVALLLMFMLRCQFHARVVTAFVGLEIFGRNVCENCHKTRACFLRWFLTGDGNFWPPCLLLTYKRASHEIIGEE
jgi:hypothetical protein